LPSHLTIGVDGIAIYEYVLLIADQLLQLKMALLAAIKNQNLNEVKALIVAKTDLNLQNIYGDTALTYACRNNLTEMALILVAAGADLNLQNNYGNNALIMTCFYKLTEVALALISAGADLNVQDNYGNTTLTIACLTCSTEVALALISARADLNIQNNNGNTALILACWRNNLTEMALILIAAGADLNIQNDDKNTALIYACWEGSTEVTLSLAKSDNLIYNSKYAKLNDVDVQKALSFNFPEHPNRYEFTIADIHFLNPRNFTKVKTLMLIRQRPNNCLHILPLELMELLFMNMFS